jgi:phosphoenolpyruvate carboxykinase (GTP)
VVPLVFECRDWDHGVFTGAIMSSEMTAAAAGGVGQLRFDPMAMLPFSGYNMADYFGHWLKLAERDGAQLPKIFHVNWFRKDEDGKFLWPGFGENSRVLEWVFRRCDGESETVDSPLGLLPADGELNTDGLDISPEAMKELLTIDDEELRAQLPQVEEHLERFGDDLPDEINAQFEALKQRLG